jgi:predicted nucleotidyltransferase
MRLTDLQTRSIIAASKLCFGEEVQVYLFGSRTDDRKKGGDIDLLIIPPGTIKTDELLKKEISFRLCLKKSIGDQRIDVLINTPQTCSLPIYEQAKKEGIILC